MKKCVFLLVAFLFTISCFSGCANSSYDKISDNSTTTEVASTQSNKSQEEYIQGFLTTSYWESDCLNLRYDLPSGWRMTDPTLIEKANEAFRIDGEGHIEEMHAQADNYNNIPAVSIAAYDISINYPNMTSAYDIAEKATNDAIEGLKNNAPNGVEYKFNISKPQHYSFLDNDYIMVRAVVDTFFEGTKATTQISWFLFRVVGDYAVSIMCATSDFNDTFEDLMSGFSKLN